MRLTLIIIIAALLTLAPGLAVAAGPPSADPTMARMQEDDEQPIKPRPNKKRKRTVKKPTKKKPVRGKPVKRPRPKK